MFSQIRLYSATLKGITVQGGSSDEPFQTTSLVNWKGYADDEAE